MKCDSLQHTIRYAHGCIYLITTLSVTADSEEWDSNVRLSVFIRRMALCDLNTLWSCQWNGRLDGSLETLERSVGGIDFKHSQKQTMAKPERVQGEVKGDGTGKEKDRGREGWMDCEEWRESARKKRERGKRESRDKEKREWAVRWDSSWERPKRCVWLTPLRFLLEHHSVFPRGEKLKVGAVGFCRKEERKQLL